MEEVGVMEEVEWQEGMAGRLVEVVEVGVWRLEQEETEASSPSQVQQASGLLDGPCGAFLEVELVE